MEQVGFRYRDQEVIRDVSLEIPSQAFMAIIGPNGGGKSTLLRLMSRVLQPQRGRIWLEGRLLSSLSARELSQQMAVISSEQYFEFPYLVWDVVAMGRFPHLTRLQRMSKKDAEVVARALHLTEVDHLKHRPISHLSSGERQRVFIARALAQEPAILMLDEPNAHLDIHHQIAIFELLRSLHQAHGITVVAVLHDLTSAAAYCPSITLLHRGRLVKTGKPEEVITRDLILETYGVDVSVFPSPLGGFPQVVFAPKN